MNIQERIVKFLESGSRGSERFKALILGSIILLGVYTLKHDVPRWWQSYQDSRVYASNEKVKAKRIEEIESAVDEARYRALKLGYGECKAFSKTKLELIKCISELKKMNEE